MQVSPVLAPALSFLCGFGACAGAAPMQSGDALVSPEQDSASRRSARAVRGPEAKPVGPYPSAPFLAADGTRWIASAFEGLVRYDGERFEWYTTEDGLPDNTIRAFLQWDDGPLWLGTTNGVVTFDGTTFTPQRIHDARAPEFRTTEWGNPRDVWDLHRDTRGRLWMATTGGVFLWNETRFEPFPLPVEAEPGTYEFSRRMVYGVSEDAEGNLWFATDGAGAVRFDADLEHSKVFTAAEHGLADDRVCVIHQDRGGTYWFGTSQGGLGRWNGVEGEPFTTHLRLGERSPHVGWGRVMDIAEDTEGGVWIGMAQRGGGAWRYAGGEFVYFGADVGLTGAIPSLACDPEGRLWFGTTDGIYERQSERFIHLGWVD